jgi:hypothetical protein
MSGRAVTECVPQPQTHCLEVRQPRTYAAQCSYYTKYQIPNTHMCKPRRKSRAQEKCRKRPRRISTDNEMLYLIGCETCMQY